MEVVLGESGLEYSGTDWTCQSGGGYGTAAKKLDILDPFCRCLYSSHRIRRCRVDLGQEPNPGSDSMVAASCTETENACWRGHQTSKGSSLSCSLDESGTEHRSWTVMSKIV